MVLTTLSTDSRLLAPGVSRSQCGVALVLLAALMATAATAEAQSSRARLSRDLAAQLTSSTNTSSVDVIVAGNPEFIERLATRHGATVTKVLATGAVLRLGLDGLRTLAEDPDAGAVTGDGVMRSQLALVTEQTGAAAAWAGEIAALGAVMGSGVGVAIVDSGIDRHTALSGRVVASVDFTDRGGKGMDQYGHGTHVAGIVAAGAPKVDTGAEPVGMAPGAHLINVKVLDATGRGTASTVIAGLDWVVANKDRFAIRVVNLSLGMAPTQSWRDDPVCQAVERAVRAGLVVVASAGNYGQTEDGRTILGGVTSPGISPFAITVGALRTNGTVDPSDDYVAPWSSKGPTSVDRLIKPDLVAPGSKVVSLMSPGSALWWEYF
jgi:serine protease AprX